MTPGWLRKDGTKDSKEAQRDMTATHEDSRNGNLRGGICVHDGQRELQPQRYQQLDHHSNERGGIIAAEDDELDDALVPGLKEVRHGHAGDDKNLESGGRSISSLANRWWSSG